MPERSVEHVVIVAHGSPHRAAATSHAELCAAVAARIDGDVGGVWPAFLDHQSPRLDDAIDAAVAAIAAAGGGEKASLDSATAERGRVLVLPHFVHRGGHTERDIPAAVDEARRRHSGAGVTIDLLAPSGTDPSMAAYLSSMIADVVAGGDARDPREPNRAETAIE